jgi:23S rRNA (uracil1939-C5)-methyltransferase
MRLRVGHEGQLGFMALGHPQIVPIDRCLLMHPLLAELLDSLDIELPDLTQLSLRAGINTGDQMITFEIASDEPPDLAVSLPVSCAIMLPNGTLITLIGSPHIYEQVAGRQYRISAPSFFQVNTQQTETLISLVSERLAPGPDNILLDAYCGVGTFALSLAPRAKYVLGIESSSSAVADARINAHDMDNSDFVQGKVGQIARDVDMTDPLVVLDPPRRGLGKSALSALVSLAPLRIAYVSCDPASLARDIKGLLLSGYHLRDVQPVDMFPQTFHTECVATLDRGT